MIISARQIGTALRILCAASLLVFGFAHRLSANETSAQQAVYALPDGSVPLNCLASDVDRDHSNHGGKCEACRIAASILLPTPWDGPHPPPLREVAALRTTIAPPRIQRLLQPYAAPRAPPASPVS